MNIFKFFKSQLEQVVEQLQLDTTNFSNVTVEYPKAGVKADFATNAAMVLAKANKQAPIKLAELIKTKLEKLDFIKDVTIAGPGFINIITHAEFWQQQLKTILDSNGDYGQNKLGAGQKVNIEYVSANPTGPMHIGHARGAVIGDVMASLFEKSGYQVDREFYINDAGNQIDILAESLKIRYQEIIEQREIEIPEGFYPGEYLKEIAQKLIAEHGNNLLVSSDLSVFKEYATKEILNIIKNDLALLDVRHDIFFSEKELHDKNLISKTVDKLKEKDLIYEGVLEKSENHKVTDTEQRQQILFKSSEYGDDKDRPLTKANGEYSYFAADLAYTQDKIDRGYNELFLYLGADHDGYIKRMQAACSSLSDQKVKYNIETYNLVNLLKDGKPLTMSKRAGQFVTTRDVVEAVGKDIVRFVMLTRQNNAVIDFDFAKVKEQSKDNPVFYVQYAYVRANSLISKASLQFKNFAKMLEDNTIKFELLNNDIEHEVIKKLALWPRIVESACTLHEPQRLCYYLQELAALFHSLWNLGKDQKNLRFVVEDDLELTLSRISLIQAFKKIMDEAFAIIKIDALTKM